MTGRRRSLSFEVMTGLAAAGPSPRALTPRGGPVTGATLVTVLGDGFGTLGPRSRTHAKCAFDAVRVAATIIDGSHLACAAPACEPPLCVQIQPFHTVQVEVALNGVDFTRFGLRFTYFETSTLTVAQMNPMGGPRQGGTSVTLTLISDVLA